MSGEVSWALGRLWFGASNSCGLWCFSAPTTPCVRLCIKRESGAGKFEMSRGVAHQESGDLFPTSGREARGGVSGPGRGGTLMGEPV